MSQILWTNEDLSLALQTPIAATLNITGISIDSRKISAGDLFIALSGPVFDGNDFIADAAAKGAIAAIVSRKPQQLPPNFIVIVVPDTQQALIKLAEFARRRLRGKIIGITGSVGKTGTKEALRHVLSVQGKTFATEGNLNNHIGLPLTLARMPADTDYAIIEMGMNKPGEIAPLSRLCEPYIGIITAIAPAHIEFFSNGLEGIADEKADITAGMGSGGVAIFHRDTPYYDRLIKKAQLQKIGRIIGFGTDALAQSRLLNFTAKPDHSEIEADILGQKLQYRIGIPGKHIAINSLAVLTAVDAAGANVQKAAADLASLRPAAGRGLRRQIPINGGSIELIDESYNANPDSMCAAIDVLSHASVMPGGRRIAILGDMLELGAHARDLHLSVIPAIRRANLDAVYLCGANMRFVYDALANVLPAFYAPSSQDMAPIVAAALQPGDAVMVKGSLGSKMRLIIESIDAVTATKTERRHA